MKTAKRGEIYWGELPAPVGRHPVLIATRTPALAALHRIVVAPISTNVRGLKSEVALGLREGLSRPSAASCDALITIPKEILDPEPVGQLSRRKQFEFDLALKYALQIQF